MKKIAYPLRPNRQNNDLDLLSTSSESIDQDLKLFFMTNLGSRVFRNNLGTKVYKYLEEPWNDNVRNSLSDEINKGIAQNFPNIILQNLKIEENKISIDYKGKNEINLPFRTVTFTITQ